VTPQSPVWTEQVIPDAALVLVSALSLVSVEHAHVDGVELPRLPLRRCVIFLVSSSPL
jgi:hypothetical protein